MVHIVGIIKQIQQDIQKQIILLTDAIAFIAKIDNVSIKEAGLFILEPDFLRQQHFLQRLSITSITPTKVNADGYYHENYKPYCFESDIKSWVYDYIENKKIHEKMQPLGFAKKRFLLTLEGLKFDVTEDDITNSASPNFEAMQIDDNDASGFAFYDELPAEYNQLRREHENLKEKYRQLQQQNFNITQYGYLNSSNGFFSIEMKLCHTAWNFIYNGENINPNLSHKKKVETFLLNQGFYVNSKALNRIATVTHPKKVLANSKQTDLDP